MSEGDVQLQSGVTEWRCPVMNCGEVIKRKKIREADEGTFPESYDYSTWESDFDFLMRIIAHLAADISPKTIAAPIVEALKHE